MASRNLSAMGETFLWPVVCWKPKPTVSCHLADPICCWCLAQRTTMVTEQSIKENYPLHWSIWSNDLQGLKDGLKSDGVSTTRVFPCLCCQSCIRLSLVATINNNKVACIWCATATFPLNLHSVWVILFGGLLIFACVSMCNPFSVRITLVTFDCFLFDTMKFGGIIWH